MPGFYFTFIVSYSTPPPLRISKFWAGLLQQSSGCAPFRVFPGFRKILMNIERRTNLFFNKIKDRKFQVLEKVIFGWEILSIITMWLAAMVGSTPLYGSFNLGSSIFSPLLPSMLDGSQVKKCCTNQVQYNIVIMCGHSKCARVV